MLTTSDPNTIMVKRRSQATAQSSTKWSTMPVVGVHGWLPLPLVISIIYRYIYLSLYYLPIYQVSAHTNWSTYSSHMSIRVRYGEWFNGS